MTPAGLTPTGLTMIKLGGSLITDKRRPGRARRKVIARLAEEIAAAGSAVPVEVVDLDQTA